MEVIQITSRNKVTNDKSVLDEPIAVTKLVKEMSELTQANNHTEALIELAKFLKHKKYINIMKGVELIHNAEGSMPTDLGKYVYQLRKEMVKAVESKYGKEIGNKVYQSM